jgi:hypothetical protein
MGQDDLEGRMEMYAPLLNPEQQLTCSRYHTGSNRCRRKLYGGQGISIHQLAVRYASRLVSTSHHDINSSIDVPCRWAIPVCMIFTWVWMRTKFHWTQYLVGFNKYQWRKLDNTSRGSSYPVLEWGCWLPLTRYKQQMVLVSHISRVIC